MVGLFQNVSPPDGSHVLRLHDDEPQPGRHLHWRYKQSRSSPLVSCRCRAKSFTKRYKIDRLVYYEEYDDPSDAIAREKEIKAWRRERKNQLVETLNPKWDDLGSQLFDAP